MTDEEQAFRLALKEAYKRLERSGSYMEIVQVDGITKCVIFREGQGLNIDQWKDFHKDKPPFIEENEFMQIRDSEPPQCLKETPNE